MDKYCKERFIDLVPAVNAFGHMKHWLARDEYHDLEIKSEDSRGFFMPWDMKKEFPHWIRKNQDLSGQMAKIAINLGKFREWESWKDYYNGNGILRLLYYHQLNDEDHDLDFLEMPEYDPDYFERVKV